MADGQERSALARILVANDGEVISRLRLSAAEAARVCKVTPRQLIYWTKKGLLRPSADSEHEYDVFAMEKAIRIRQALAKGLPLEKAAQQVERDVAALEAEVGRLEAMSAEQLEEELARRLERLEERTQQLRRSLAPSLGVARLRKAVATLARLENDGALQRGEPGDGAKGVVLRLGRAITELEELLREVEPAAV